MNLNRRQMLGVIGTFVAAPTLLVAEKKKKIVKLDEQLITTGFPMLDEALGGGLRRGTVSVVMGKAGSGKSALMRTMALNAAKKSSAGFVPEQGTAHLLAHRGANTLPFEGHLWYYPTDYFGDYSLLPASYMPQDVESNWHRALGNHDILFDESFGTLPFRNWYQTGETPYNYRAKRRMDTLHQLVGMAYDHDCAIVLSITTQKLNDEFGVAAVDYRPLAYMPSVVLQMRYDHTPVSWNTHVFRCCVLKNRWKGAHPEVPMYLNTKTFRLELMPPVNVNERGRRA